MEKSLFVKNTILGVCLILSLNSLASNDSQMKGLTRNYWSNFTDDLGRFNALVDFGAKPNRSQQNPTGTDQLVAFESVNWVNKTQTANWADNYAQRIYGYITPDSTGNYEFYLAGNPGSELFLSYTDSPDKINRIAEGGGAKSPRSWFDNRAQKSRSIHLVAGRRYFIEARSVVKAGDDFLAVAWAPAGSKIPKLLEGKVLSPYNDNMVYKALPATQKRLLFRSEWYDRATLTGNGTKPAGRNILWYRQPAPIWEAALPLGSGKLGAMVFGGVADERIQLNECTLYDGYSLDPNDPASLKALPDVQRMLFEGKNNEAVDLASKTMMGKPKNIKPYQSLGEIWLDTPNLIATNYTRSLDLSTAIATVKYVSNGVEYLRESFATAVDGVIITRISANKKGMINLNLTLKREQDAVCMAHTTDTKALVLRGKLNVKDSEGNPRGISFAAQLKAINNGGEVIVKNSILSVRNANSVVLIVAGATNYPGLANIASGLLSVDPEKLCTEFIAKASKKDYNSIKVAHIADHQKYYNRVSVQLGEVSAENAAMPTDKRLDEVKRTGKPDAGLVETFFQFGRYLLIGSSRPGSMPANLQGIWAWQMYPPWNADFHTNINVQMNYWPAEITNLSELHLPLFDLSDALVKPGERTAKVLYGARGWVVHHLTDAWGFTAPADGPQGIWPMGSAWLAQHPWEHYSFTQDKDFLSKRGYPLMKGAARFILDFLVEAPAGTSYAGKLVTNPSYSPENGFLLPNGQYSVFTYGATMDLQIIHNLLTNCIEASKILNTDNDFRVECEKALAKLAPTRISPATGRIMEWAEDYKETEPHHRHTSHLFGLHPGNQITAAGTPELAAAARKTLEGRGDDGTGWSLAWKINMWGRLLDGDHAYKLLCVLLSSKTLPNLFDNHPPFQIDGNFGATAAIAEMLVQSHNRIGEAYEVHLLPALPSAFPSGEVNGLLARGGFEVSVVWKNSSLIKAQIKSKNGGKLHLRLGEKVAQYDTKSGDVISINESLLKY